MKKLFILFCAAASATAFPAAAQTFSTGTYNVRQLNAGDDAKGNGWQRRLPVIASLVRFHDFDIFGAQEVFHSQLEDLLGALPGYGYTGVGRDDGAEAGEYSIVFYKRDRFELLDSGHFWLAEDPSRPNKGWDAKYVRICCWGRFLDRETRERFWFFTLHTDHKGERAQVESCRLVLDKIRTMCPVNAPCSRAISTSARRARAMPCCATRGCSPIPTTWPRSNMPGPGRKTASIPTARPSAISTTSS